MSPVVYVVIGAAVLFVLIIIIKNICVVQQSRAYVIERLGAFSAVWEVGIHFKIPFIERIARRVSLKDIVLLPGETDAVMWASFGKVHWMIRTGKICKIIGSQFRRQEKALCLRNLSKSGR